MGLPIWRHFSALRYCAHVACDTTHTLASVLSTLIYNKRMVLQEITNKQTISSCRCWCWRRCSCCRCCRCCSWCCCICCWFVAWQYQCLRWCCRRRRCGLIHIHIWICVCICIWVWVWCCDRRWHWHLTTVTIAAIVVVSFSQRSR